MTNESLQRGDTEYYEVWDDTASVADLAKALTITVGLTMAAYLLVPWEAPAPLIAGLVGAVAGFVVCSLLIPTKRRLDAIELDDSRDAADGEAV